ncbi:MAG TPA: RAMP superfamily CRISPR-associated protein [Candidatus Obscuribacterales bacterium]
MTNNRPQPATRPISPKPPEELGLPKPYQLISLPNQSPKREKPAGQDRFKSDRLSGFLELRLTVKTSAFIASGVVAMGSDLSTSAKGIPLIKTSVERDQRLLIPGSSLKGVVRSTYEAITSSCLCKVTKKYQEQVPSGYKECVVNRQRNQVEVCPACQVFGAMDWQGLIHFTDAECEKTGFSTGFMPSLYRPRPDERRAYFNQQGKVAGRKFYYHAVKAVDKGQQQGIPVQQAGKEVTFTTQLRFMNLTQAQLGTLLIVLAQDFKNIIALKVGGGKPIGMGTMVVDVKEIKLIKSKQEWRDRYSAYGSKPDTLTGNSLKEFITGVIQVAHREKLVQDQQLQELKRVLQWPTDRQPPEGMY